MSFANKVVIITGASSGIGAAAAILFTKEGANVTMVGRNETKLKAVADKCTKAGKTPLVIRVDVSKDEEAKRIVKETIDKFGRLDVLVNNAGMSTSGTVQDGKLLESYDVIMSINVRAVINITCQAVPHLVKTKGNIINISSVAAKTVPVHPDFLAYGISKAALDHFTKGCALEMAASGVRVNSVNPGPVVTDFFDNCGFKGSFDDLKEMTAMNRNSSAEEVADLIMFLAGDKAKGITGSTYVVDNGYLLKH